MKAAGCIVIGKTHMPEFGLGSQTYNPVFGATRNDYDPALTAGGSSGGAAVALALRMLPVADGSDMMGSLRNPAAWNNVIGFRPSYGRVPGDGPDFVDLLGYSGPMGRTVPETARLLATMAGFDARDPLSVDAEPAAFAAALDGETRGLRIGWLGDLGGYLPMEQGVLALCRDALGYPVQSNSVYNSGGIVDSVELLVTHLVRIEDLHLLPDSQTGRIQVRANLRNAGSSSRPCWLQVTVAPATGGESVAGGTYRCEVPPGDTLLETGLAVERHRLWELADPFLYRITASLLEDDTRFSDERSPRCGCRDFRFDSGYFRFNGRSIFLHGMVCQAHYPAVYTVPGDRAMLQRDVVHLKALGFNACRLTFGGSLARQLDLFDELGIQVYHEHYGSDMFYGSGILPKPPDFAVMKGRFTKSVEEIVRRGRNHPSVVVWGLLNETGHKELLAHATATLPLVRALDPTRLVVLNSGGGAHSLMSNPHTDSWRTAFSDEHKYPVLPSF